MKFKKPQLNLSPMRKIIFFMMLVSFATFVMAQTAITPAVGDGSQGSPYEIQTWENLYWLSQNKQEWDKYFIQTADIDFADATPPITEWDDGKGWTPIGEWEETEEHKAFSGSYNGQNFSVSSVFVNRGEEYSEGIGFFGTAQNATIKNLKILNVDIFGYASVGGLVGINWNSTIERIQITGSVRGRETVGGLAGNNNGNIQKSYTITDVFALTWHAGGFAGQNGRDNSISECFSAGTVQGRVAVGGFVGGISGMAGNEGKIENCFSLASVIMSETGEFAGGFVGDMVGGTIRNCFSVGSISYENTNNPTNRGFVGNITQAGSGFNMSGNFWDKQTSGQNTSQGSTDNGSSLPQGKTTAEMKSEATFTGWDFSSIWQIDPDINNGYPHLKFAAISMPVGSGSEENPYIIATLGNLRWFVEQINPFTGKYFLQTQDIDASATQNWNEGEGWKPKAYFMGTYDGGGFAIDGLFMNAERSSGLFDYIESATIKNLGLTNVDFTGAMFSGGLAGSTESSQIENCFVTGSVKGSDEVGGLVGRNGINSTITQSSFNGTVTGEDFVGGFIGRNDGNYATQVTRSYAAGKVMGDRFVGGFVGANYIQSTIEDCYSRSDVIVTPDAEHFGGFAGRNENAAINKCYATGLVDYENEVTVHHKGFVGSCVEGSDYYMIYNYWDMETSAQNSNLADANAATGLTSTQMKTQESFQGWDFENIWIIKEDVNDGYPSFKTAADNETSIVDVQTSWLVAAYPNPFKDYIAINNMDGLASVIITNLAGQTMMNHTITEGQKISTSDLPAGIYLVNIINKTGVVSTQKMVKM
jgi:hypothetical protein